MELWAHGGLPRSTKLQGTSVGVWFAVLKLRFDLQAVHSSVM